MKSSFLLVALCPLLLSGCKGEENDPTIGFINELIENIDYRSVFSTSQESTVFTQNGIKISRNLEKRSIEEGQGVVSITVEKIPQFGGSFAEEVKVEYVEVSDKTSFFDLKLSRFLIDAKLFKKEITSLNNLFTLTALEGAVIDIDGVEGSLKSSTYQIKDRAIGGLELEYEIAGYSYKMRYGIDR